MESSVAYQEPGSTAVRSLVIEEWAMALVASMHEAMCGNELGDARGMLDLTDKLMFEDLHANNLMHQLDLDQQMAEEDTGAFPKDVVPPTQLMLAFADDLSAYLTSVFASKAQMFDVDDLPDELEITGAIDRKLSADSEDQRWQVEMVAAMQNAVKYNRSPVEIRLTPEGKTKFKALCPHNTFYDSSVMQRNVATDAMFAGYVSLVNLAEVYRDMVATPEGFRTKLGHLFATNPLAAVSALIAMLHDGNSFSMKSKKSWSLVSGVDIGYHTPWRQLAYGANSGSSAADTEHNSSGVNTYNWGAFLDDVKNVNVTAEADTAERIAAKTRAAGGKFERFVMYRRGRPDWLGLPAERWGDGANTAANSKLPVYKITILNGVGLLAVEPIAEDHGMIPIVFGGVTVDTDGVAPLGFSYRLAPLQAYDKKGARARIAAIRRALADKIAYNSQMIDPAHMKDRTSDQRIPVNPKTLNDPDRPFDIRSAMYQLPSDMSGLSAILGDQNWVMDTARRVTGNSLQMQGGRTPGNKIAAEANREASISESRFRVYALSWQQTFMQTAKRLIRSNVLQQPNLLLYRDPVDGQMKAVDPARLAKIQWDFKMSDGMLPTEDTVSPDVLNAMFTMIVQIPQLQQDFPIRDLFIMLGMAAGFKNIGRLRRPMQEQQQAMAAAPGAGGQPPAEGQPPAPTSQP